MLSRTGRLLLDPPPPIEQVLPEEVIWLTREDRAHLSPSLFRCKRVEKPTLSLLPKVVAKKAPEGLERNLMVGDHGNTLLTASFALHKRRAKEQCALPSTRRGNMRNVNNVGGNNTGKLYI